MVLIISLLMKFVEKYAMEIKHKNGSTVHAVLNKAVIRDDDGKIIGIVGIPELPADKIY